MSAPSIAIGTIIASNYLARARVLADSLRRHHPDLPLFVLVIDGLRDPARERFRTVRLDQMAIADPDGFRSRSTKEVAAAAKPYLLQWLLREGFERAFFIDPDVLVLGDLSPLFDAVSGRSIALTPHFLVPPHGADRIERELNILQSGVYNGGLVGVSRSAAAMEFLTWWADRVASACREDVGEGLYYDQKWLDLVPMLLRDVAIVRDAGCNVAHWNLREREIRVRGDEVTVDGHPCRFVHFSGYDPARPSVVTRYSTRPRMAEIGEAAVLFERYASLLWQAGHRR